MTWQREIKRECTSRGIHNFSLVTDQPWDHFILNELTQAGARTVKFLNPAALAWGSLALPILILYMLKLRRKEVVLSSIFLWQRLIEDRQANSPWQRIQRNILLLLQLGVLLFLVAGLARPVLDRQVPVGGSMIVLLDASASMQATDVTPSRFGAAVTEALQLVRAMGPSDAMTVILVSANPEIIAAAETDKSILSASLAQVTGLLLRGRLAGRAGGCSGRIPVWRTGPDHCCYFRWGAGAGFLPTVPR